MNPVTCWASWRGGVGETRGDDLEFLLVVRIIDPVVQAASFQGIVDLAGAVGSDDDHGRVGGVKGAQLGNGDLVIGQEFQEEPFKLLIGAVELVNEEHRGAVTALVDGFQKRALDQELRAEQVDVRGVTVPGLPPGLHQANFQQLAGVVPLVDRVVDVEALVALQPDQIGAESGSQSAGDFGLADAGLAFQEQRAAQLQRQEDGDGEPPVSYVSLVAQQTLDVFHGGGGS